MQFTKLEIELARFIDTHQGKDKLDLILKKQLVDIALIKAQGNQTVAAKSLGMSRGTLREYMKK